MIGDAEDMLELVRLLLAKDWPDFQHCFPLLNCRKHPADNEHHLRIGRFLLPNRPQLGLGFFEILQFQPALGRFQMLLIAVR